LQVSSHQVLELQRHQVLNDIVYLLWLLVLVLGGAHHLRRRGCLESVHDVWVQVFNVGEETQLSHFVKLLLLSAQALMAAPSSTRYHGGPIEKTPAGSLLAHFLQGLAKICGLLHQHGRVSLLR
jgi:hypothetical protein